MPGAGDDFACRGQLGIEEGDHFVDIWETSCGVGVAAVIGKPGHFSDREFLHAFGRHERIGLRRVETGEGVIEDPAEREQIAPPVMDALRVWVVEARAAGDRCLAVQAGQTRIGEHGLAINEQNIGRTDVTVAERFRRWRLIWFASSLASAGPTPTPSKNGSRTSWRR